LNPGIYVVVKVISVDSTAVMAILLVLKSFEAVAA
jgi:hypothetical protein